VLAALWRYRHFILAMIRGNLKTRLTRSYFGAGWFVLPFTCPIPLNTGSYLISVGISEGSENGQLIPLDRLYDAIPLPVDNPRAAAGHLDLNARFSLSA